jgi:hypothetical protein
MKRILFAVIITALAIGPAFTLETCASKAVSRNGKLLAGAALKSFLKNGCLGDLRCTTIGRCFCLRC